MNDLTKLFKLLELTRSMPQSGYALLGLPKGQLSDLAQPAGQRAGVGAPCCDRTGLRYHCFFGDGSFGVGAAVRPLQRCFLAVDGRALRFMAGARGALTRADRRTKVELE